MFVGMCIAGFNTGSGDDSGASKMEEFAKQTAPWAQGNEGR